MWVGWHVLLTGREFSLAVCCGVVASHVVSVVCACACAVYIIGLFYTSVH